MAHPSLGLPPHDVTAGLPDAAARLRANRARLAKVGLQAALRIAPDLRERHDDEMLRLFLRDYDSHIEQLARALETGEDGYVVNYGEWLMPTFRRRGVPANDFIALLAGLREAAATVLTPSENEVALGLFERWGARLKAHGRLPGDHKGNSVIRFFWKAAGVGDDKWI